MATMTPGMAILARYLPDWQYGVGADLQAALSASGLAKPLNYSQEALRALGQLRDSGAIGGDVHDAIAGHQGRLMAPVYNALRNQALLNHGIDLTAGP